MIDAVVDYDVPKVVHECVIKESKIVSSDPIKKAANMYMKQLEGWCTSTKASILIDLIYLLKPDKIVEIGVWGGKSLVPMGCALKANEKGIVVGIDPWKNEESIKGQSKTNREYWQAVDHVGVMEALNQKISAFSLNKYISLVRDTSENAAPIYDIDILHIDGNHSVESALIDLRKWVPLVKKGGLVIFDDMYWAGQKEPVEWLNSHCIQFAMYKGTCQWGIWIKP